LAAGAGSPQAIAAAKAGAHVTFGEPGSGGEDGSHTDDRRWDSSCFMALKIPRISVDIHFRDIVTCGHILGDPEFDRGGGLRRPERIDDLQNYGAKLIHNRSIFSTAKTPLFGYSFLPGLSFFFGYHELKVLRAGGSSPPEITFLEDWFIFSLLTVDIEVTGALCLDMRKERVSDPQVSAVILLRRGRRTLFVYDKQAAKKYQECARDRLRLGLTGRVPGLVDMEMTSSIRQRRSGRRRSGAFIAEL